MDECEIMRGGRKECTVCPPLQKPCEGKFGLVPDCLLQHWKEVIKLSDKHNGHQNLALISFFPLVLAEDTLRLPSRWWTTLGAWALLGIL